MTPTLQRVIESCLAVCAAALDTLPGLEPAVSALRDARLDTVTEPGLVPGAGDTLKATTALATTDLDAEFRASLLAAADELSWFRAYSHYTEADMVRLQSTYAVAGLVGGGNGEAPVQSDLARIYVTVQDAGVTYPSHAHKATELYHVVAGRALWEKSPHPFQHQEPGAWIVHPTATRHAMETVGEPLLAMAIWTDSFDDPPVIVRH